jgi:hypothetical protein
MNLVLAIYLHAFNIWKTASDWKGSPGEALARSGSKTMILDRYTEVSPLSGADCFEG